MRTGPRKIIYKIVKPEEKNSILPKICQQKSESKKKLNKNCC